MILFELNDTNLISANFKTPAQLSVFGLSEAIITEQDGIVTDIACGDVIRFERLAYDGVYDIDCHGISEAGVKASAPLLDECGCEVLMNANQNSLIIEDTGLFRAIYHGDPKKHSRENILLIKEDL